MEPETRNYASTPLPVPHFALLPSTPRYVLLPTSCVSSAARGYLLPRFPRCPIPLVRFRFRFLPSRLLQLRRLQPVPRTQRLLTDLHHSFALLQRLFAPCGEHKKSPPKRALVTK